MDTAVVDRLVHPCVVFQFNFPSYRLEATQCRRAIGQESP